MIVAKVSCNAWRKCGCNVLDVYNMQKGDMLIESMNGMHNNTVVKDELSGV